MKRILFYIIFILSSIISYAQIIETGESNPIWGVRAAFDVNLPGRVHINEIDDRMFCNGTGGTFCVHIVIVECGHLVRVGAGWHHIRFP